MERPALSPAQQQLQQQAEAVLSRTNAALAHDAQHFAGRRTRLHQQAATVLISACASAFAAPFLFPEHIFYGKMLLAGIASLIMLTFVIRVQRSRQITAEIQRMTTLALTAEQAAESLLQHHADQPALNQLKMLCRTSRTLREDAVLRHQLAELIP